MELIIMTAVVFLGLAGWMMWNQKHQSHPQKH